MTFINESDNHFIKYTQNFNLFAKFIALEKEHSTVFGIFTAENTLVVKY